MIAVFFVLHGTFPLAATADKMDTRVEDALDVTMAQQTERDYLIYNDPLSYADLILNGDPEEYLKNATGSHRLEIKMNAGHYRFFELVMSGIF